MSVVLDVEIREATGTGNSREARRNGFVPGVIYGGDEAPVTISAKFNEVLRAINTGQFLQSMIEISHDGKKQKVLTKDVQFHPVSDMPVHMDLFRVTNKTIIEVEVSVNFVGDENSPGLKEGGVLNVVRHAIEVKCPAGSIPDHIDVDISKMEIGDSIHISEVDLPKDVKPAITDRDFTIATVLASRSSKLAEGEASADGEEAEAGDVPATEQKDED
ncbi:large subunit ribosomal protein L25 [Litorimonas taeanensis]|uniref:Large ribosomal subunit protein bL25 n=1 Tax=Litorimonas taeanensis TaxID=568099 RepID=A0A420WK08_9PROT|nr:50S ribosomal protein L25/general stress protein Ctc [Litorimonas taeanensis]RKQ71235.1 large subunit ribosomal protein L25 [Litorimonas taeanensis]